jgi:hypothetical protein
VAATWIDVMLIAGLALGGGTQVEATGQVTSPPAPGSGLVSTTESSSVTLRFPPDGGPVTGEVVIVNRVEFTEVFCVQRATFRFALTGQFDAGTDTMEGQAQEGGSTQVVEGCEGLTTSRTGFTTPWTAALDRASGQIAGRLAGGAPVDFVAQADPAVLAPEEPPPEEQPAEDPPEEPEPAAPVGREEDGDDDGGNALPQLVLALVLFGIGGYVAYRVWPRPQLTLPEVHRLLGQAAKGAETVDPADRAEWRAEVVKPVGQVARGLPEAAAPLLDDVRRLEREVRGGGRHRSLSEGLHMDGIWGSSGNPDEREAPDYLANDLYQVQQKVAELPEFEEVIL